MKPNYNDIDYNTLSDREVMLLMIQDMNSLVVSHNNMNEDIDHIKDKAIQNLQTEVRKLQDFKLTAIVFFWIIQGAWVVLTVTAGLLIAFLK